MDARRRIDHFLAEVRRRLLRRAAARAALAAFAIAIVLAIALPLWAADEDAARPARAVGIVALVGLVGAVIASGVIGPRRRLAGPPAVARFVGQRAPAVASDLLSAVELAVDDRAPHRAAPVSAALIAALTEATAVRTAALDPAAMVDRAPLRRPALAAALALVALAAVIGAFPERVTHGVVNLIAPAPPRPFADAERSAGPLVGDLTITLEPPAYTGRPPTTLPGASGDFRAMPGTRVRLATETTTPVERAFLVMETPAGGAATDDDDHADALVPLAVDGRALHGELVVAEATRYRFLIVDPAGRRQIEIRARAIEIEVDRAPSVELHAPADELDVSGLKRIELAYLAEDDHGIATVDLVWRGAGGSDATGKLPLVRPGTDARGAAGAAERPPRSAQDKIVWDLAEVGLRPGAQVEYWIEVTDNDSVRGPNRGESRHHRLRVLSPRERHERLLASQRDALEKLIRLLAGRLTAPPADRDVHDALVRESTALVVEIGTLVAALEKDALADRKLVRFFAALRTRLDKATGKEGKLLRRAAERGRREAGPDERPQVPAAIAAQLGAGDRAQVAALEDEVLTLADWIDRQGLEDMLAMADEIAAHRQRLDKLLQEYARTGSKEIAAEIERELKALEQLLAEQAGRRDATPEDVLDQFVNTEAIDARASEDCLGQVRALVAAGDAEGARAKMAECGGGLDRSATALEEALGELRGDRFGEEQQKLDALQNDLEDLAEDQREIAGKLDQLHQKYAAEAAARTKEEARAAAARLGEIATRLQRRLDKIPEAGLGAFEKEELGAARTRLADLERMLADGDLAEALAMARHAEAGLETIAGELEAAAGDGDRDAARALEEVERAQPLAEKLVEELDRATPSPGEILGPGELEQIDKLRRAQQAAAQRAARLGGKAKQMAGELPGKAGEAIGERLGKAGEAMGRAEGRLRARDPSSARAEARAAADALDAAREEARGAARMRQAQGRAGMRDEPVRIPGAEEYRPPADLREQIMEAMKRQGEAPSAYGEMLKRYYEELAR